MPLTTSSTSVTKKKGLNSKGWLFGMLRWNSGCNWKVDFWKDESPVAWKICYAAREGSEDELITRVCVLESSCCRADEQKCLSHTREHVTIDLLWLKTLRGTGHAQTYHSRLWAEVVSAGLTKFLLFVFCLLETTTNREKGN